jgi:excisionase family DNA binding protein
VKPTALPDALALAVPHAAALLDISPRTVWSLISKGELHTVRIGRRVLIEKEELVRWLRANRNVGGKS